MLLNCNSCQKKFIVPNDAISIAGRLVQCGSCGNRWTQFPIKEQKKKESKKISLTKIKIPAKDKKRKISLYSTEYLEQKHGLKIKNFSNKDVSERGKNVRKNGFGFYGYLISIIVILVTIFGVLNLSKETIVFYYPNTEEYIEYLFEVVNIMKIIIIEFVDQFKN